MIVSMSDHKPTKSCSVAGCDSPAHLRGLCIKHYGRFMRTGTTDHYRDDRGMKTDHPFWMRFNQLSRRGELVTEWMDFWAFVDGISPKPENAKKMYRPDVSRPYGPDNFAWRKTPTDDEAREYVRDWHRARPEYSKNLHFQKQYGITFADYQRMVAERDGRCDICGNREGKFGKKNRRGEIYLCVDHDHETGEVRGLLCADCNVGLGAFKDNPTTILRAIGYLRHHQRKRLTVVK